MMSVGCLVGCIWNRFSLGCGGASLFHGWVVWGCTDCWFSIGFWGYRGCGCRYLWVQRCCGLIFPQMIAVSAKWLSGWSLHYIWSGFNTSCVITAGDHLLESGSYTRTRCSSNMIGRSRMCRSCWDFWYDCLWFRRVAIFSFWLALFGHFTGNFPTSFRLYRSSPGDGITWSILCMKTSWDITRPNGILRKQNLPNGEGKVVNSCDSSSSGMDQYPFLVSNFEKFEHLTACVPAPPLWESYNGISWSRGSDPLSLDIGEVFHSSFECTLCCWPIR